MVARAHVVLVLGLVAPIASAHFPGAPSPNCFPNYHYHEFGPGGGGASFARATGGTGQYMASVVDGAIGPCPGVTPPGDGDPEFGYGGAYLQANHHNVTEDGFVVTEFIWTPITSFVVGVDGNGDGLVDQANPADCHELFAFTGTVLMPEGAGTEVFPTCPAPTGGGWWVFVSPSYSWGHVISPPW